MMVSDKRYKNLGNSFLLISLLWSIFYFFSSISDFNTKAEKNEEDAVPNWQKWIFSQK